jgi:hypothetical protein
VKDSSFTLSTSTRRLLTLTTAAGLGVDAYVHWHLAGNFDTVIGTASPHFSQGELFRLEATLALIAMVLVLATRRRFAAALAFLIAAGGLGALLLYGYVDMGGFGPVPDMYDPSGTPRRPSPRSPKRSPPWERWPCSCFRSHDKLEAGSLTGRRVPCGMSRREEILF